MTDVKRLVSLSVLNCFLETATLHEHELDALFYVRGCSHEFAEPVDRDAYLRVLLKVIHLPSTAVAAFLRGWGETYAKADVAPFAWHRYMAGTELHVTVN